MPWTDMGYTCNWNCLEDGVNGHALDPFRVGSYVGPAEFVVSAGAWVEFESFVEKNQLFACMIPEPGGRWLVLFALVVLAGATRLPRRKALFDIGPFLKHLRLGRNLRIQSVADAVGGSLAA